MACGLLRSAWVSSHGPELREREDGRKGRIGPLDEGRPSHEEGDQAYGEMLTEMAKKHSSEAFYALDDPLEAAVFSLLVELVKAMVEDEANKDTRIIG